MSQVVINLNVHTHRFSSEEVVINSDVFTWVKPGDVLVIYPKDRPKTDRLAVRVTKQGVTKSKHGRATLQVSVLKGIADRFGLLTMQEVIVARVDPQKIGLDALQLTFDSQFLSRSVLWRISRELENTCLSRGKSINILGHKLRVQHMFINGAEVTSGLVQSFTKVNFRSRSARILWMVQLSREMWDFANDGDIFFEKAMKSFFQPCFEKWQNMKAKHSLTVIYYTRTIFHEHSAAMSMRANKTKLRPSVCKDPSNGALYEDVFHTVLENETPSSWPELMSSLKRAFMEFPAQANWTHVPSKDITKRQQGQGQPRQQPRQQPGGPGTTSGSSSGSFSPSPNATMNDYVAGGCPAPAAQGNFFEALNLALNIFDLHHMDRDLTRTGQGVVLISPGIGLFEIDRKLLLLTKRRLLDSGVGIDLLCLNSRPLHQVPLLIYKQEETTDTDTDADTNATKNKDTNNNASNQEDGNGNGAAAATESDQMFYNVPHWLRISFPAQPDPIGDNFSPLPTHRMLDLLPGKDDDGMQEGDVWWGSGVVKNRVPPTLQTILKSTFGDRDGNGNSDGTSNGGHTDGLKGDQKTMEGKDSSNAGLHPTSKNVHYPKFFRPAQETAPQPQAARESTDAAKYKIKKSQSRVRLSTTAHGALPRPFSMSQRLSSRGGQGSASSMASYSGSTSGSGRNGGGGGLRPASRMEYQSHDMKVFSAPRYKESNNQSSQPASLSSEGGMLHSDGGTTIGRIQRSLSHTRGNNSISIYDSAVRSQRRKSKSRLTFNTFNAINNSNSNSNSGGGGGSGNVDTNGGGNALSTSAGSKGSNGSGGSASTLSSSLYSSQHHHSSNKLKLTAAAGGRPVSNLTRALAGISSNNYTNTNSNNGRPPVPPSTSQRQTWGSTQQQAIPDMVLSKPSSYKGNSILATSASSDTYLAKTPPMRPNDDPYKMSPTRHAIAARAVNFRLDGNHGEIPKSPNLDAVKQQETSPTRTGRFGSPPRSPPSHLSSRFDASGIRRRGSNVPAADMLPLHLEPTNGTTVKDQYVLSSHSSKTSNEGELGHNNNNNQTNTTSHLSHRSAASNSNISNLSNANTMTNSTSKRLRNIEIGTLTGIVNPFNQKQSQRSQHIEKISSSRRRWRHLYTKAFDALRGTGLLSDDPFALDWPSLTEPAILPLTMDYFPNENELRSEYSVTELYKLSLPDIDELELMGYKNGEDLVTELVCQRLAQDFQIVTASDGAGEKLSGGLKYHLMYRHIIHKLTYEKRDRNIEVTVYTHRRKAKRLEQTQYYYPYTVLDLYDNAPHSVGQTFTSIIPSRWGYLDGVIVGYNDQYDKSVRYRRLHYLLIPPLDEVKETTNQHATSPVFPWSTIRDNSVTPALSSGHAVVMSPPTTSHTRSRKTFNSTTGNGEKNQDQKEEEEEEEEEKEKIDTRIKFFQELVDYLSKMSIGDLSPMSVDIDTSKRVVVSITPIQPSVNGTTTPTTPSRTTHTSSIQSQVLESAQKKLSKGIITLEEYTQIVNAQKIHDAMEAASNATSIASTSTTSTTSTSSSTKKSISASKRSKRRRRKLVPQRTTKIRMKSRKSTSNASPQWIFVEYDKSFRTDRCYRITLQFLVCTGATMLDFTSSLNKVCKKGNILMMQVPEYTHPWQNPYIHAFLVPLHLPMPLSKKLGLVKIVEDAMVSRYGFVLEADVEWSLNDTQESASSSILQEGSGTTTGGLESDRWAGKQYLHRTGGAFIRILKDGLLWIPNRMLYTRKKWNDILKLFIVFRTFTLNIMECFDVLMNIIDVATIEKDTGSGIDVPR